VWIRIFGEPLSSGGVVSGQVDLPRENFAPPLNLPHGVFIYYVVGQQIGNVITFAFIISFDFSDVGGEACKCAGS
jgi:hypothetical protein